MLEQVDIALVSERHGFGHKSVTTAEVVVDQRLGEAKLLADVSWVHTGGSELAERVEGRLHQCGSLGKPRDDRLGHEVTLLRAP